MMEIMRCPYHKINLVDGMVISQNRISTERIFDCPNIECKYFDSGHTLDGGEF